MTKAEMLEKIDSQENEIRLQREKLDHRRRKIKEQNAAASEKWDCISCRLPKGTKARITSHGFTVNGFINDLVIAELDRLDGQTPPAKN